MSQVAHALRIASTLACCIVIAAFVLWAGEQGSAATDAQAADVTASAPAPAPVAPAPEPEHDGLRGALEDSNAALLSPFDHVADDGGPWAAHAFPALLALLTYGVLARVLIPYLTADGRTR